MKSPRRCRKGFTLIELLLSAVLSIIVAMAVAASISSGAAIWKRSGGEASQDDTAVFLDRFSFDLRNYVRYQGIPFRGVENSLEFAVFVKSSLAGDDTVGKVMYVFSSGTIVRTEWDFSGVHTGRSRQSKAVIKGLDSAVFSFYGQEEETEEYVWYEEWKQRSVPVAPIAVRVEMVVKDGDNEALYTKTVNIPAGGKL